MKKTIIAIASISIAAYAYASTDKDSSAMINQQCKISAEAVSSLKQMRYGNIAIRKDVTTLINVSLKAKENKEAAQATLNRMVDDSPLRAATLEEKYCS